MTNPVILLRKDEAGLTTITAPLAIHIVHKPGLALDDSSPVFLQKVAFTNSEFPSFEEREQDTLANLTEKSVARITGPSDLATDTLASKSLKEDHLELLREVNEPSHDFTLALVRYKQEIKNDVKTYVPLPALAWLSVKTVAEGSRITIPGTAVAVLGGETPLQDHPPRLIGYGHLNADNFSEVAPVKDEDAISWQRSARVGVIHRRVGNVPDYDVVVTGPAGQTYPTKQAAD